MPQWDWKAEVSKVSDKWDATKPPKLRYNTIKDYRGENRWLDLLKF